MKCLHKLFNNRAVSALTLDSLKVVQRVLKIQRKEINRFKMTPMMISTVKLSLS